MTSVYSVTVRLKSLHFFVYHIIKITNRYNVTCLFNALQILKSEHVTFQNVVCFTGLLIYTQMETSFTLCCLRHSVMVT